MTRALPLAAAAMLVVAACSAPDTPETAAKPAPDAPETAAAPAAEATPEPATVHVRVAGPRSPEVEAWAEQLTAAIEAGQGDLVLVSTPEEAGAVVLIEGVETGVEASPEPAGEGPIYRMRGSLVIGDDARAFSLSYRGEVRAQAEALARNLPRFAQEAAAGGATVDSQEPAPIEESAGPEGLGY